MIEALVNAAEHADEATFPTEVMLTCVGFRVNGRRDLAGMRHSFTRFLAYDEAKHLAPAAIAYVLKKHIDDVNASLALLG